MASIVVDSLSVVLLTMHIWSPPGSMTMVDASTDVAYQRVVVRDGVDPSTSGFSD
ncbi:MAG: hypothetical protein V3U46_11450 [Acidimicrobiia bacterium]